MMIADKSKRIALFVDLLNVFELDFSVGVERYVREHDSWDFFTPDGVLGPPLPLNLNKWDGDGILGFVRDPVVTRMAKKKHIPLVNVSWSSPDFTLPTMLPDNVAVAKLAADYFLKKGFRNFALCCHWPGNEEVRKGLHTGFSNVLSPLGLTYNHIDQHGWHTPEESLVRERMQLMTWLKSLPKPVAVLAQNDVLGTRVLSACLEGKLDVPGEVAVIAIAHDGTLSNWLERRIKPSLSTIESRYKTIGYAAAALLNDIISGKPAPKEPILLGPTDLIERQSTDVLVTGNTILQQAITFIAEHACDPITVDDVLKQLPVKRRRFESLFQEHFQRGPNSEILRIRIKRARELLAQTDMPVHQIAQSCGFNDHNSFCITFRRETELSPTAFRKKTKPNSQ